MRFQVQMNGNGEASVNRAASLLALGCMVRGESPKDYAVWVPADETLIRRIRNHAEELLHIGRGMGCSVSLSPREGEVLKELMRNRLNKEIADRLRISVRTVKFHVSSLLSKFGVGSRWDLIQKAQHMLGARQLPDEFGMAANSNGHASQNGAAPPAAASEEDGAEAADERIVPFRSRLRAV